MNRLILVLMLACFFGLTLRTQARERDVFVPIAKYIQEGDSDCLSAWLAENLELNLMGAVSECSRNQAKQILKNFFTTYRPKSFSVVHKSLSPPMTYAIAKMNAGGERSQVTIFVTTRDDGNYIQHLRIERE